MKYIQTTFNYTWNILCRRSLKIYASPSYSCGIYGMAILFIGLMTGLIKLEAVRETGKFLIEIYAVNVHSGRSGINE